MKITFDLSQFEYRIFNTEEEYDNDDHSSAGYDRWHKAPYDKKPYPGPCHRFYNEPYKFPCNQIEGDTWDNPNGPYEIRCTYFYDFELTEDNNDL